MNTPSTNPFPKTQHPSGGGGGSEESKWPETETTTTHRYTHRCITSQFTSFVNQTKLPSCSKRRQQHNSSSSPFFFTLAVEGPKTAVALDERNETIVTLHFDSYEELFSDSFKEFATAAVAAVIGNALDDDDEEDEDCCYSSESQFLDLDEVFAAALQYEMNHHDHRRRDQNETRDDDQMMAFSYFEDYGIIEDGGGVGGANASHDEDADFALALSLQQEEEDEAAKVEKLKLINRQSSSSSREAASQPPLPSFSTILGAAPGITIQPHKHQPLPPIDITEFPSLQQQQQQQHRNSQNFPSQQSKGVVVVPTPSTAYRRHATATTMHQTKMNEDDDKKKGENSFQGYRRTNTLKGDAVADVLDSFDGDAIEARAQALQCIKDAKYREESKKESKRNRPPSVEAVRRMMESCSTKAENEEEEEEEGDYRIKKIRKLVLDMIASGWRPVPGRGGGHYVYQRFIPPTGEKQLLVLASTPSDVRSIRGVNARLQRLDREAAAVRAAAAAAVRRDG